MRGITLGAREAGSDLPFGTPTHVVLNSFTPETERTTHHFWSTVRSWGLDDANVPKTYKDMTDLAFAEDARIVESQQQLIDSDFSGAPLVSLAATLGCEPSGDAELRLQRLEYDGANATGCYRRSSASRPSPSPARGR